MNDPSCVEGFCSFGALCKPNSQQLLRGNQLPYCVCPLNRFGERCDVEYDQCASNPCHNGGSCFPTSRPHQFMCLCTDFYYGQRCELRKPRIQLYVNETVHHAGGVVQYFRINFVSLDLILIHQQAYRILPTFFEYQHNDRTAPEIIAAKLYSSYADIQSKIYLLSLHINVTSIYGTTQMVEKNQCVDVRILTTDRNPIQYHHLCQISPTVMCFYDQSYPCICTDDHSRVECFGYDHHLDSSPHCRAGGRCLKANDFICLCPPCHSGSHCQFSSNSFTFTLDQLFFTDLTSAKKRTTVRWLIIAPLLLFFIALPSNLFSLLTFRRRKCLRNGIGQYLFCISIINQISIAFLVARLIHLTASITSFRSHSITDHILCKVFGCFLTCSTRITFWLASFISVERVYTTLFLNKQWLKQPRIARRIIGLTFFITLLLAAYEIVFVKSISREINGHRSNMCVMNFPVSHQSLWMIIHQIVTIINSIFPLLISIICTITMICVLVKKKMNIRQNRDDDTAKTNPVPSTEPQQEQNLVVNKDEKNERNRNRTRIYRLTLLFGVINENKEMIARPAVTLVPAIFSLFTMPHLIVSFSLGCQNLENSPLRYLLIASYFLSFVPQIVTFFLYIYPSSLYWNEWCETPTGTCISRSSQQRPLQTMTAVSAQEERSKLQTETPRC